MQKNGATSAGIWLAVGKKGNRVTALTYEGAVEEAVCIGWIDSTVNRLDADRFKQLFTPRNPKSAWSKSNKERVERLTAHGRMCDAGLAAVEAAKANGSWSALDDVENLVVPNDLAKALVANPDAAKRFAAFNDSTRKRILFWVCGAKRPATRAKRIAETISAAEEGRAPGPIGP